MPGIILIKSSKNQFTSGAKSTHHALIFPKAICVECLLKRLKQRGAFVNKGG